MSIRRNWKGPRAGQLSCLCLGCATLLEAFINPEPRTPCLGFVGGVLLYRLHWVFVIGSTVFLCGTGHSNNPRDVVDSLGSQALSCCEGVFSPGISLTHTSAGLFERGILGKANDSSLTPIMGKF